MAGPFDATLRPSQTTEEHRLLLLLLVSKVYLNIKSCYAIINGSNFHWKVMSSTAGSSRVTSNSS